MDIEQLRAKYAAAFDDDFDMPRDSDEESTDINASEDESEEEEEFEGTLNRTIRLWNFLLLDVLFMYNIFLSTVKIIGCNPASGFGNHCCLLWP